MHWRTNRRCMFIFSLIFADTIEQFTPFPQSWSHFAWLTPEASADQQLHGGQRNECLQIVWELLPSPTLSGARTSTVPFNPSVCYQSSRTGVVPCSQSSHRQYLWPHKVFADGASQAFQGIECSTILGGGQSLRTFSILNVPPLKGAGDVSGEGSVLSELYSTWPMSITRARNSFKLTTSC